MRKRICVAHYQEDLSWLKSINVDVDVYVYHKYNNNLNYNEKVILDSNNFELRNVGREGETYLRYILDNYPTLSEYTILCQGDPFYHCKDFTTIVNNFTESTSVKFLADWIVEESLDGAPYGTGYGIYEVLVQLGLHSNVTGYVFPAGAQYIIPRSFILNKSIDWWRFCYDIYNSNEKSAWIFERLWPLIFNYESIK